MASIYKRGNVWRAQININGNRQARSFDTKSAATQWAKATENEILKNGGKPINFQDRTVGEVLERYQTEVAPKRRGWKFEQARISTLLKESIAQVKLNQGARRSIALWRDEALKVREPGTVRRDMTLVRAAIKIAINEWEWADDNPLKYVTQPKAPPARTRLPQPGEIEAILKLSGYSKKSPPITVMQRVGAATLFAMQTGLRAGEIALLEPSLDKGHYVHLPDGSTKSGRGRNVALTKEARRILDQVGGCFDLDSTQISANFKRMKNIVAKQDGMAEINSLHFHDLRAYALTMLAEKLHPMELAKLSGHQDVKVLLNTYYRNDVDDTAAKIGNLVL